MQVTLIVADALAELPSQRGITAAKVAVAIVQLAFRAILAHIFIARFDFIMIIGFTLLFLFAQEFVIRLIMDIVFLILHVIASVVLSKPSFDFQG